MIHLFHLRNPGSIPDLFEFPTQIFATECLNHQLNNLQHLLKLLYLDNYYSHAVCVNISVVTYEFGDNRVYF